MPDVINKPFDVDDLALMPHWMSCFDDYVREAAECGAIASNSQMRRWEYGHLLQHSKPAEGLRVIDIGCDKTYMPVALKNKGCEVFAVDMNFSEHTENWYRHKDIHVWRCDALSLPYPDRFFDRVYSVCVGEHIGDTSMRGWGWNSWAEKLMVGLNCFLKECVRVLKPGGIMAHTFDFYFPSFSAQPAGLNPDMAGTLINSVCGAQPMGGIDFSPVSYERNIPKDYQKDRTRSHTTVAMFWKRT